MVLKSQHTLVTSNIVTSKKGKQVHSKDKVQTKANEGSYNELNKDLVFKQDRFTASDVKKL